MPDPDHPHRDRQRPLTAQIGFLTDDFEANSALVIEIFAPESGLAMMAVVSALAGTTFTSASGPKCKDESKPESALWTCPGPAGYAVRFSDEGNMASLTLAPASSIAKAGKAFGDKVQWIIRGGVPRAAVIRTRLKVLMARSEWPKP